MQLHQLKGTAPVLIVELVDLIRTCESNSGDSDQVANVHGLIIGSVAYVRQSRLSTFYCVHASSEGSCANEHPDLYIHALCNKCLVSKS